MFSQCFMGWHAVSQDSKPSTNHGTACNPTGEEAAQAAIRYERYPKEIMHHPGVSCTLSGYKLHPNPVGQRPAQGDRTPSSGIASSPGGNACFSANSYHPAVPGYLPLSSGCAYLGHDVPSYPKSEHARNAMKSRV